MEAADACGIISESKRSGRFQYETTDFCVGSFIEKQKTQTMFIWQILKTSCFDI